MISDHRMNEKICLRSMVCQNQCLLSSHLLRTLKLVQTDFEVFQTIFRPILMRSCLGHLYLLRFLMEMALTVAFNANQ